MVGVRTSNRCGNCRKRKKKCDEKQPSCSECIRAGWTCPGYKTEWKFVDETVRLAEHYADRKYVYDRDFEDTRMWYDDADRASLNLVLSVGNNSNKNLQVLHYKSSEALAKSEVPRYLDINPLGTALVYCLESKVRGMLIPLWVIGSFFQYVPARLGRNKALDDVVSCLNDIYCATSAVPYNIHKRIYGSYVRALSSLRHCLDNTSLQMESETLCASILLQICELIVNDDIGDWSGLAGGTKFLIRSRGVHRYNSPFDLTMLESQMSFVLGQSLKSKEPCFLSAPEWQALVLQIPAWPFQNLQSKTLSLRSRLGAILVESPSLIMQFSAINEKYPDQTDWEEQSGILMQKALILLGKVKRYRTLEAEPLLLSYASSQKVVQERIEYPDVISGVLDCVANTALLTIDNILRSLCDLRLRSFGLGEKSREQQLKTSQLLDDPEIVEQWRQRAIAAFNFVHSESVIAAKPLAFGLRHAQCGGFPSSVEEMTPKQVTT